MGKLNWILTFVFIALTSCSTVGRAPGPSPSPQVSNDLPRLPSPAPSASPAPSTSPSPVAQVPVIRLGVLTGAIGDESAMVSQGVRNANAVLASPCMKAKVMGGSFTEANGLSPGQIWAKLASTPVTVNVDLFTGTWAQNHLYKTIGYEDEPGTVHINRYFVGTAYMVGDNLIHEGEGHSQGFSHYQVKATSVPYQLNAFYEACAPGVGVNP